jgi:hypothetical protein
VVGAAVVVVVGAAVVVVGAAVVVVGAAVVVVTLTVITVLRLAVLEAATVKLVRVVPLAAKAFFIPSRMLSSWLPTLNTPLNGSMVGVTPKATICA